MIALEICEPNHLNNLFIMYAVICCHTSTLSCLVILPLWYTASSLAATQQLKPLNRPPEYYTLLNKLAVGAVDKWKEIGLALNIPIGQLNSITTIDPILCYAEIFNWWQRNGSPPYTWATIIDALKAPIVGEVQLAHELEEWLTTVQAPATAMPSFSMLLILVL